MNNYYNDYYNNYNNYYNYCCYYYYNCVLLLRGTTGCKLTDGVLEFIIETDWNNWFTKFTEELFQSRAGGTYRHSGRSHVILHV